MRKVFICCLLSLFFVTHAFAVYVVILKDGKRVVAREKYQIKGAMAYLTTRNGTATSLPLSRIDVENTEKFNARNLGDSVPLDWVDDGLATPTPVPSPTPGVGKLGSIRPGIARAVDPSIRPTPTPSISYREVKYKDPRVQQVFEQGFEGAHLYLYRISQGTHAGNLFFEIQVNGQLEVLKALQTVCLAYHLVGEDLTKKNQIDRLPEQIEVLLLNESGKEAGVFRIPLVKASELATGKVTPENFFVQNVIF